MSVSATLETRGLSRKVWTAVARLREKEIFVTGQKSLLRRRPATQKKSTFGGNWKSLSTKEFAPSESINILFGEIFCGIWKPETLGFRVIFRQFVNEQENVVDQK